MVGPRCYDSPKEIAGDKWHVPGDNQRISPRRKCRMNAGKTTKSI